MNGAIPKHSPSSKSQSVCSCFSLRYLNLPQVTGTCSLSNPSPHKMDTEENSCDVRSPWELEGPSSITTSASYSTGVRGPASAPPPPCSEWSAECRDGPASDFSCWLSPLPPRHFFRVGSAPQFRGPCWACDKHFINIHPLRDVEQPGKRAASARVFSSVFPALSTSCPPLGPGWPRHRTSPYDAEMPFLWNGSGPCPFEKPRAMTPLLRVNGSSSWMRCGGKVCTCRKSFRNFRVVTGTRRT